MKYLYDLDVDTMCFASFKGNLELSDDRSDAKMSFTVLRRASPPICRRNCAINVKMWKMYGVSIVGKSSQRTKKYQQVVYSTVLYGVQCCTVGYSWSEVVTKLILNRRKWFKMCITFNRAKVGHPRPPLEHRTGSVTVRVQRPAVLREVWKHRPHLPRNVCKWGHYHGKP